MKVFPSGLATRVLLVKAATRYLTTAEELEQLRKFVANEDIKDTKFEMRLSVEYVRAVVSWVDRDTADLENWLGLDLPGEL